MRISAFLQLYNELSNGHLRRCLDNCRQWADAIYIYDDCSDDGSRSVYLEYTSPERIILGERRDFDREIFHKQQLLELVRQEGATDWIAWIDGDAVFDANLTSRMREILSGVESLGADAASAHNLNLWRSESWYRLDSKFNNLDQVSFWKCSPALYYSPEVGLHRQQFPLGIAHKVHLPHNLLHYGFATREGIIRKYLTYKSLKAAAVDRLICERKLSMAKVPAELYPPGLLPPDHEVSVAPERIEYDDVSCFGSLEEYLAARQRNRASQAS